MNGSSISRIKVLQVLGKIDAGGGIETWLMDVLRGIDRERFEVDICSITGEAGNMGPEAAAMGYRIIGCPMPYRIIDFIFPFYKLLKSGSYDVVHSQLLDLSGPPLMLAGLAKVPVRISHYHNTSMGYKKDVFRESYMKIMHLLTDRYSTAVFGCSGDAMRAFFGDEVDRNPRYRVMHYGIAVENFSPGERTAIRMELGIPADAVVVGHVGRFAEQKNHRGLVELGSLLAAEIPSIYFLLVGEGELLPAIRAEAARAGLENRFVFTGLRRDVNRLYEAMDFFVFPSLFEGFGIVLIEAQAAGVPVIASDLPAHRESVAQPMWELFFKPEQMDRPAKVVLELLRDKSRYEKYRQAGIAFADGFSIVKSVQRLEEAYISLVREARS